MALPPDDVVIVLGPRDTVVDVNTVEHVLSHIVDHVVSHATADEVLAHAHVHANPGAHPVAAAVQPRPIHESPGSHGSHGVRGPSEDRLLRFFSAKGEILEFRIMADWWTFCLEATGRWVPVSRLQSQVHQALEAGRPAVEAYFRRLGETPPELPPRGSWEQQLEALRAMDTVHLPGDRQGWFHNFFVHGWL